MIPLTKKYAPKDLKGIKGQDDAVKALMDYIANFKKEKNYFG